MQFGLAAAITELEVWSNSPISEYARPIGLPCRTPKLPSKTGLPKETPVEPQPLSREFLEDLKNAGMREEVIRAIEKDIDDYEARAQDPLPPEEEWK